MVLEDIEELKAQIDNLINSLQLEPKKQKLLELQEQMNSTDFWTDSDNAQRVSKTASELTKFIDFWEGIHTESRDLLDLFKSNKDQTEETLQYLDTQYQELHTKYLKNRVIALLSKKYDDHDALLSFHAGAGGLDAQDWTEMLFRMMSRYCDKKGFSVEILDFNRNPEGGLKSATIQVSGPFAYGYLKSEAGVHRLVRLSPFNPAHTRETSFALIELLPVLERNEELTLDPKDLDIEANTSSGHGGQSVNTTYSAIRITHKPTGIRVSIQNERSQHQNKELALKILQSKLKALEEQNLAKEKKELRGEFKSAEWGNQIRSYVLHPYQMVKDHRTNIETSDTQAVLDGEIDEFVEKYLESRIQ